MHPLVCHVVGLLGSSNTKCGMSVPFAILRETLPNIIILGGRSLLIHFIQQTIRVEHVLGHSP